MTTVLRNWLQKHWPQFTYDKEALANLEQLFVENSGMVVGALKHVNTDEKNDLLVETLVMKL